MEAAGVVDMLEVNVLANRNKLHDTDDSTSHIRTPAELRRTKPARLVKPKIFKVAKNMIAKAAKMEAAGVVDMFEVNVLANRNKLHDTDDSTSHIRTPAELRRTKPVRLVKPKIFKVAKNMIAKSAKTGVVDNLGVNVLANRNKLNEMDASMKNDSISPAEKLIHRTNHTNQNKRKRMANSNHNDLVDHIEDSIDEVMLARSKRTRVVDSKHQSVKLEGVKSIKKLEGKFGDAGVTSRSKLYVSKPKCQSNKFINLKRNESPNSKTDAIAVTKSYQLARHPNEASALAREADYEKQYEDDNIKEDCEIEGFDDGEIGGHQDSEIEGHADDDMEIDRNGDIDGDHDERHQIRPNTSKHRNRVANRDEWPREITKLKREHGEAYIGYKKSKNCKVAHDIPRSERKMGPRCTLNYCLNSLKIHSNELADENHSSKRHCNELTEEIRLKLFENFWDDMTWDQKKFFIVSLIDICDKKTKTKENSRRTFTYTYYLRINGKRVPVCKPFFLSTFGLNEWMVQNWLKQSYLGIIPAKPILNKRRALLRPISKFKETNEKRKQFLIKFFDDLPKMESHYCRQQTDKLYLQPDFESLAQLYGCYVELCLQKNEKPLSDCLFSNLFYSSKLSLFQPKKDRCDTCMSYETGNLDEDEYENHIREKERARTEKNEDKAKAIAQLAHVLLMDVEAVKLLPVSNCSSYYYKTKLKMHNFTIFNAATSHCVNYWWHEGQGGVLSSMFATCILMYLQKYCRDKLPVILWSDGCTYQNRNQVLLNALLDYAIGTQKNITQKFLVKGHTQMEVDNIHMLIEKKLKKKLINLPSEYISITKKARSSNPLKAVLLTHKDFKNFDDSNLFYYSGIRPGTKKGDPTVYDIRSLYYSPTGSISYKLDFDGKMEGLPGGKQTPKTSYLDINPYYTEPPKITKRKYDDLQDLKCMIPKKHIIFMIIYCTKK